MYTNEKAVVVVVRQVYITIIVFSESTFPSAHDTVELQKPVFLLHSYPEKFANTLVSFLQTRTHLDEI